MADAGNTYIRSGNIYTHEGKAFVGGGIVTASQFYKGQKHQTAVYLNGGYHGEDLNADLGSGINYRFVGSNDDVLNMSVFMVANPGFEADDAKILKGMDDRDISGDIGLNADFHLGQGTLSGKFQHDVTGVYKSFQTDLTYYHPMAFDFMDFVPYAGVHYYSEDYVNYYAGVSSSEATVGRSEYKANGAFAYRVGYTMIFPITEHLDITQATGYSYLDSALAESPLIDNKNQWATTFGVNYTF
ncbi:MipA/OmpV family protein [Vibrio artabrorum]|uniref:MipA/OmpV family protein n=1 Tax=Vibrio artabrorum TaxID=446374 RepID=A0ABT8CPM6_9VIBR|nr:MipA/OmpV family protein [Vibrio artabrorum]MDN3702386.1 MipA/OmpV family protein [Vibrio artabrorum]